MKRIGVVVFAAAAVAFTGLAARAADLSVPYKAPIAVPAYSWTGFYLGIDGGYGWGKQDPLGLVTDRFAPYDYGINGGMFGGTFGAQIQSGHVVLGLEGDIDWASITGTSSTTVTPFGLNPVTVGLNAKIDSVSTLRARVGYGESNWLFYVTGGLGLMGNEAHLNTVNGNGCGSLGLTRCDTNPLNVGIAGGLGVEWGFASNWSAKLEYLHIAQIDGINTQKVDTIRAGINYRFTGF